MKEQEFTKIIQTLQKLYSKEAVSEEPFAEKIKEILNKECKNPDLRKRLMSEFTDCGPLHSIIEDPSITEIIIHGKDCIFYEKEGQLKTLPDQFLSKWTFSNFIHRICSQNTPSLHCPFANGKWKNFRVHITAPPVSYEHPYITLRRHPFQSWTLDQLKQKQWAPPAVIDFILQIIKNKMNILIAGSTSSGKTSVLNACLQACPSSERIIIIEDTDELAAPNSFSLKLLTRSSPHLPEINQSILVQQCLRMRPDRIAMGEVRGKEAKDLIMALATGHQGSFGTLHADHHKQALLRLELLIQSGSVQWEKNSIRQMIQLGIQIILIVKKKGRQRYLDGIYQITGLEKTGFLFESLFQHETQLLKPMFTHAGRRLRHQTARL